MPQVALDLNLSTDLFLHLSLLQLAFVEDLERAHKAGAPLLGQVHSPELALSERSSDLEHA